MALEWPSLKKIALCVERGNDSLESMGIASSLPFWKSLQAVGTASYLAFWKSLEAMGTAS